MKPGYTDVILYIGIQVGFCVLRGIKDCRIEEAMKLTRAIFLWLLPPFLLIAGSSLLQAQVVPAGRAATLRGKIASVQGQELIVAAPAGEVRVKVPDTTTIRIEVAIDFSDITPGMFLGTTAEKQADGMFRASEVHVFSEDERGVGEGHRPLGSAPQSGATMTNANIERVEDVAVRDVKGRLLSLKYKGGEVKVFVPPDIPIVKRQLGDRGMLKPGAEVSIQGSPAPDGSFSASQITVRARR